MDMDSNDTHPHDVGTSTDQLSAHLQTADTSPPGLLERLLSPESLQKMMACGGGLLVAGFVIWLWRTGVFDNPQVVAGIIGTATLGTMICGSWIQKRTPYELAGNGLALLGALSLPLNLWFYHAQHLISLTNGGHLWIPAAVICVIYASAAWFVRDARYLYAFVGGVVLTGMLFLADHTVNRFWHLMPQVSFLLGLGWSCVAAERTFPTGDSDFSRNRFGRALRLSGYVTLGGGLLLLLGAELSGIMADWWSVLVVPEVIVSRSQKLWALGLLTASSIGFVLDTAGRKNSARGKWFAAATAVWATISLGDVLGIRPTLSHVSIATAGFVIASNIVSLVGRRRQSAESESADVPDRGSERLRLMEMLTGFVCLAGLFWFNSQYFAAAFGWLAGPSGWQLAVQLLTAAVAAWTTEAARVRNTQADDEQRRWPAMTFIGSLTAPLALWSAVQATQHPGIVPYATVSLSLPLLASVLACVFQGQWVRRNLRIVSGTSLSVAMVLITLAAAAGSLHLPNIHLFASSVLSAMSTVFYLIAASRRQLRQSVMGPLTATLSTWQGMVWIGADSSLALVVLPTLYGLLPALVSRGAKIWPAASGTISSTEVSHRWNLAVLLGNGATALLACNRLAVGEETAGLLITLVLQIAAALMMGLMNHDKRWKNGFRISGIILTLVTAVVGAILLQISGIQRLELLCLTCGVAQLVIGYLAWAREGERPDDLATVALIFGTLFVIAPLSIGLVYYRTTAGHHLAGWELFHEIAAIVSAILLLGSGLLSRVRATTLGGTVLLAVYVGSLAVLVNWPDRLLNVSVLMMIGGGLFFGSALLLSVYRDWLLALPGRVREGNGVFQVLKWR